MPSKTLQQLRLDSRRKAELTNDADAISDDELNGYINESWHEMYDLMIDADDARTFAVNAGVLPQVGDFSYRLPVDMYRLVGVHVRWNQYYTFALRADSSRYAELIRLSELGSFYFQRPEYYYRWDVNTGERDIFMFPRDAGEIAVIYFPQPRELTADTDSLDNPASWLEFVSLGAAIKMLDKLERDASRQLFAFKRVGQRIQDAMSDLDMHSPARIRDTAENYGSGGWGFG